MEKEGKGECEVVRIQFIIALSMLNPWDDMVYQEYSGSVREGSCTNCVIVLYLWFLAVLYPLINLTVFPNIIGSGSRPLNSAKTLY